MKIQSLAIAAALSVSTAVMAQGPAEQLSVKAEDAVVKGQRNITLIEDRDQDYMTTKVYEIKNMKAVDLRPFVEGAVRRADGESTVGRLNYKHGKKQFLQVCMPTWMVAHIDDMVAKLDRPSPKDEKGAVIDGTGIHMFYYRPKHRSTEEMRELIFDRYEGGDDIQFRDAASNLFYWKGSASDGKDVGKWLKAIDRPIPQMELSINVYEITDNDLKELGIDYVAWKNGPGANLFWSGFDFLDAGSFQDVSNFQNVLDLSQYATTSWSGFMFAPNIDATFLRILAQKGKANIATSNSLTIVNDQAAAADTFGNTANATAFATARYRLRFQPTFQRITKDGNQQLALDTTNPDISFYIQNPVINFDDASNPNQSALLNFGWVLNVSNSVVEHTFNGTTVANTHDFRSHMTLRAGSEKLLASYEKDSKVDQDNGIIGLSEIPVLKYIFGSAADTKTKTMVYLTVEAKPIQPETSLSPWAGQIVTDADQMLGKGQASE